MAPSSSVASLTFTTGPTPASVGRTGPVSSAASGSSVWSWLSSRAYNTAASMPNVLSSALD